MADQLTITNQTTGLATVVAVRLNADGQFWNTSGSPAFETYNAANIANYGIAMSEVGATGVYTVDDPAPTVEGSFIVAIRAGASLAVSDLLTAVGQGVAGPVAASEVLGAVGSVTGNVGGNVVGSVASVTGNVGGNVVGSVGSVTGAVGSVTSPVTVGTNNDKTGYSLTATTGLGNQTADITGSLSGSVGSVTGAVGSVTGAVGSVTGNVGGNVVGSVASVVGAVGSVTGNVGGNVTGSVGSVLGGINTTAGTITTLDALDTAQDTQHSTTQTYLTNNLGAAGAAATEAGGTGDHLTALATATELAKVPKSDGTTSWNATALASINAEADTALSDFFTSPATLVDLVWDEVLTGATHNVQNSAGKRLRDATGNVVTSGTAQAGGTASITLATAASSTNGTYDPAIIWITAGTGVGQARLITQYVGSTRVATVDRDWRVVPDATSEYEVIVSTNTLSTNEGLAQGGTSTSITLNAAASAVNDTYAGQTVVLRTGTGQDQSRVVESYNGTTKVATVTTPWVTTPDTTTGYIMWPIGRARIASIEDDAITSAAFSATALAAINAEVDTAIADYDPPTNAEMVARTLAAADYFDPTADPVARVTLVDTTTANTDMRGTDNAALATALATAQTDLDTLTGADGVTLATSQPNYAPATATALATVDTVVDGIKAVTDLLLTATGTIDNSLADATTTVFKTNLVAVNDFYNDQQLLITSGSLAGQVKPISDFSQTNGVITLAEGLTTAPENSVTFAVLAIHVHSISQIQSGLATDTALQTVDDEVGSIATSINSGSVVVASVTGAVGSVTDPVTAGTVNDKTGYSLDTNQAFNNTGTFTGDINGNVTGSVDSVTSGVTLAASQPLYTPAVAGDAMALTSGERTTLAGVIWGTITSGLTAVGSIGKLIVDKLTPFTFTNANKVDATMLATDATTANKVADHVRRRTQANVEASADGDSLHLGSEYGMIQMTQESNTTANPGSLTVFQTDGATELGQKTLATDATADPITGVS